MKTENKTESGSLTLDYKGDMEERLKEYFDSRLDVLYWHIEQYKRKIERAEERIKKYKRKKHSLDWNEDDWDAKIRYEESNIRHWENIIENHIYEPIGWLCEIKHEIMKID